MVVKVVVMKFESFCGSGGSGGEGGGDEV